MVDRFFGSVAYLTKRMTEWGSFFSTLVGSLVTEGADAREHSRPRHIAV